MGFTSLPPNHNQDNNYYPSTHESEEYRNHKATVFVLIDHGYHTDFESYFHNKLKGKVTTALGSHWSIMIDFENTAKRNDQGHYTSVSGMQFHAGADLPNPYNVFRTEFKHRSLNEDYILPIGEIDNIGRHGSPHQWAHSFDQPGWEFFCRMGYDGHLWDADKNCQTFTMDFIYHFLKMDVPDYGGEFPKMTRDKIPTAMMQLGMTVVVFTSQMMN